LSDPRIKKIIKSQLNEKPYRTAKGQQRSSHGIAYLKLLAMVVIAIGAVAIIIYPNRDALPGFWDTSFSSAVESNGATSFFPKTHDSAAMAVPDDRNNDSGEQILVDDEAPIPDVNQEALPVDRGIQVEVLNGCGVKGIAEKFTNYLRNNDIDVVSRGNYTVDNKTYFDVTSSMILDRSNNHERAVRVARLLGIPSERILLKESPELQLDLSIIVGADYKTLKAMKR
jgi:hypothetical protein